MSIQVSPMSICQPIAEPSKEPPKIVVVALPELPYLEEIKQGAILNTVRYEVVSRQFRGNTHYFVQKWIGQSISSKHFVLVQLVENDPLICRLGKIFMDWNPNSGMLTAKSFIITDFTWMSF